MLHFEAAWLSAFGWLALPFASFEQPLVQPFPLVFFLFLAYVQPIATAFLLSLLSSAASPLVSVVFFFPPLLIAVVAFAQSSPFGDYTTLLFCHLEAQTEACPFFSVAS